MVGIALVSRMSSVSGLKSNPSLATFLSVIETRSFVAHFNLFLGVVWHFSFSTFSKSSGSYPMSFEYAITALI